MTFDQIVALPAAPETAFKLQRQSDGALVGLAATANNTKVPGTVVTLAFTGGPLDFASLADGRYAVTVFAAQVASLYDGLDGNTLLNPGDSPPDGYAGGDYMLLSNGTTGVFRLFGDASGDASVGFDDLAAFQAAFGTNNFAFDFDGNGVVDTNDYKQFRLRYRESLP